MANNINSSALNPQTATLADVIATVMTSKLSDGAKLRFVAKASQLASDKEAFEKVVISLNYFLADSAEEYDGDGKDIEYDELAIKAENARREAEEKAAAEKREKDRLTRIMNAAAGNLAVRGIAMFKDGELNPEYQRLLNEEIAALKKGKRLYSLDTGEVFVPDMEMSGLNEKQKAAIEKAEVEEAKSNRVICNEDKRPMTNGDHNVKIVFYQERKGRDGKSDYAVICVEEVNTGKKAWLPSWSLADPAGLDRSDAWRTRLCQLKSIAENNNDCIEGMTEDEAVEYLREHSFKIYTYQKTDGNLAVYVDQEAYKRFIARQAKLEEKAEEASKRDAELAAIGLNPDKVEPDESIEAKPWKH